MLFESPVVFFNFSLKSVLKIGHRVCKTEDVTSLEPEQLQITKNVNYQNATSSKPTCSPFFPARGGS